jgi:hypothetical protein
MHAIRVTKDLEMRCPLTKFGCVFNSKARPVHQIFKQTSAMVAAFIAIFVIIVSTSGLASP